MKPVRRTTGRSKRSAQAKFTLEDVRHQAELAGEEIIELSDGGLQMSCLHPDHDDETPSMSVTEGNGGIVLVHCHAGCDQRETFDALVAFMRGSDSEITRGCTLSDYADLKQLPTLFLEELGLRDDRYKGAQRLVIPYGEDTVRYRTFLSGSNKFAWKSGSSIQLYGLAERERFDDSKEVLIVEGESCAQTAWFHGFAAFGVPGASNWKEERDAKELDGFSKIYVLIEPDRGGEAVLRWLSKSSIQDRAYLLILGLPPVTTKPGADPMAETETEAGWAALLRDLRARGLAGVRLAVSDDHFGLKAAIQKVIGCSWQRCTVHFICNMHGHCRKGQRNMVGAALREVFNAEDLADAKERAASVIERLKPTVPKVAGLLTEAEEDLLAFYRFPQAH